jgi:hypothetical protein
LETESHNYPQKKKNKFIQLYNNLTKTEKKEFREYVTLKFVKKNRDMIRILDALTEENKILSDRNIWNRTSELKKMFEDYLIIKHLQEHNEERYSVLMEVFSRRNMNEAVKAHYNASAADFKKNKFTLNTFFNLYRIESIYSSWLLMNNEHKGFIIYQRHKSDHSIAQFLNNVYIDQIDFTQQKVENIWHDFLANEAFLASFNSEKFLGMIREQLPDIFPFLNLTYNLYKAFDEPDNTFFYFNAKKIFEDLFSKLGRDYAGAIYQMLINYCINRTNDFDTSFNSELFCLFNEKLERGFDDDIRSRNYPINNFRDYVIIGLRVEEYEWVSRFIDKYGEILPEDYKQDETGITRSMLFLSQKKYDLALESLKNVKRKNYLHYFDTAQLKLRIFYETDNYIQAFAEHERALKYFSANTNIPEGRSVSYIRFLKFYKRLLKLKEEFRNDRLNNLELAVNKSPQFSRKNWIEEKIKDLRIR